MPVASARPDQNPKAMASQSGPEGPWPTGARWRVLKTPCLGKRPQIPKPKGPGRPWGQKPLAHGHTAEREFPVLLTAPRGKKPKKKFRANARKTKKNAQKHKNTPKKQQKHQKTPKNTKKTTNFFSRLRAKNKSQRQKKKANSHGPAGGIKQGKLPLWHTVEVCRGFWRLLANLARRGRVCD